MSVYLWIVFKQSDTTFKMAMRQQTMINCLGKYCRQYFLFKEEQGMDQVKVRIRSDIHRVEQANQDDIDQRILQR